MSESEFLKFVLPTRCFRKAYGGIAALRQRRLLVFKLRLHLTAATEAIWKPLTLTDTHLHPFTSVTMLLSTLSG